MINVELYINDQRVDLFKDENIQINLIVKNFQNIDKVFNDFTQNFTIPASKRNNQVFEHWYNKGVTTSFNPAVKIPARIELNSILFRRGLISINKAAVKNGLIDYYDITFFGGNSNLNQLFGDDYLNQLDLSAYDLRWDTYPTAFAGRVLSNNVLIPLLSTYRNWQYNQDNDADSIRYFDNESISIAYDEVRAAITLTAIIDAIEVKYGITINSDFFATTQFGRLFMWAQREAGSLSNYAGSYVKWTASSITPDPSDFYDLANQWFVLPNTGVTTSADYTLTYLDSPLEYEWDLIIYDANSSTILEQRRFTSTDVLEVFTFDNSAGGADLHIEFYFRVPSRADVSVIDIQSTAVTTTPDDLTPDVLDFAFTDGTFTDASFGNTVSYKGNLPNQTVNEFLGGLVKMFNLVITPVSDTEFNIEPLDDFYAAGSDLDIGKYINSAEYSIEPAELFGEITFKYSPSNTILAKKFRDTNDQGYGDLRSVITDPNGDPISKQSFNVELPFTNIIWEKLLDQTDNNTTTNIIVGKFIDDSLEPVIEKPYIFYYVGAESISGTRIAIKNNVDTNPSEVTAYNLCYQFYGREGYTESLNFGSEINPYTAQDGTPSSPSLFNDYWSTYITDLYAAAQRRYTFKGVLPTSLLNDLELNSSLVIGLNKYRINSMQVDLTTGEATLDLINIIA